MPLCISIKMGTSIVVYRIASANKGKLFSMPTDVDEQRRRVSSKDWAYTVPVDFIPDSSHHGLSKVYIPLTEDYKKQLAKCMWNNGHITMLPIKEPSLVQ